MNKTLKTKFLDQSTCYFCGDDIHNYELSELFDNRIGKPCFECYITLEIGKMVYYCKLGTTENYVVDYFQMYNDSDDHKFMISTEVLL